MAQREPLDPQWAWQRYQASAESPWDVRKVGHLYRRAAFGATAAELDEGVRLGPERTIELLLNGRTGADDRSGDTNSLIPAIRQANNGNQLSAWWLYRMLYASHPLREKLTLFWHNHFATSNLKVNNAGHMLGQYELLRRHAQGNFRTLLQEISTDPAMLIWLDTNTSPRQQPNENYARELMELFSLGINNYRQPGRANYTEEDIREAARAFTGWRLENNRAVFRAQLHDDGEKNVLGQRGRWRAHDIVRICLEQESCAYFITAKLFNFLIGDELPATPELLEPLATRFRDSDYNFGALVETVLRSNLFFAPAAYRSKVKSPIDFTLGMIRSLEGHVRDGGGGGVGTLTLVPILDGLGQRPFYPPSVAGWDGGRAWLNGQTLLLRQNLALALTSTFDNRFDDRCDPARLLRRHQRNSDAEMINFLLRIFLQDDLPAAARNRLLEYARQTQKQTTPVYLTDDDAAAQRIRTLSHMVLTMPEYQLA